MLLALLLALAASQEPVLLPEAPAGWRFERLDFPLDFAPGLELAGFEELRFAPGMFEAGSPSFFSYALALRLEEDLEVDAVFLRGFLESYYRGLCQAVGGSRGLEIAPEDVSARVQRSAAGFSARIDLIEPFVTGEALTLRLELLIQPGARSTEVLGLVSPAPAEAPIWSELRALAQGWRRARPVPVLLNHLFVVPDPETYAALLESTFLGETLAVSEQRDTTRRDLSYSGLYLYGQHTYFEFLRPDPGAGFAPGATGLAFGLDVPGATERVAATLAQVGVGTFPAEVTRDLEGESLPWFRMLGIEQPSATSRLSLFTLEYDPRFLERWHGDLAPATGGIERAAVLERYAAALGLSEARASTPFSDVEELRLALDEPGRTRLFEVCRALGWIVEARDGGWICDGPQATLVVVAAADSPGLTGFTLRLRHPVEHAPLELGRCRVEFTGQRAAFDFEP